ncbi:uncharacterized protein LOC131852289 [Achroia grisella]|uniref:uncharacterized protein LOC131852289 n=1 Tax=Achroia grisella TaxID=688607 RepID=UPI0027D1F8D5|nr:uncharacterized protein LOC131852289 [Achroia grisella]
MISEQSLQYKKVQIHITTFETELHENIEENKIMNKDNRNRYRNTANNKTVCSICLNTKTVDKEKIEEIRIICPICHKNNQCDKYGCDNRTMTEKQQANHEKREQETKKHNTKVIQTSHSDITQGLNLLNEVLTVFQSKKQLSVERATSKTALSKDAYTITEVKPKNCDLKPKLSLSRVFQYSIEEDTKIYDNYNFRIVHYFQPDYMRKSQHLIKRKSSSIPQMKLEELKHSLKEKNKSKDTIQEVNRMFATVKKNEISNCLEYSNRPAVRNGPRILPVVKTKDHEDANIEFNKKTELEHNCTCCGMNQQLSSGDSLNHMCHKMCHEKKCDKCIYTLCCHYENSHQIKHKPQVCEFCKKN